MSTEHKIHVTFPGRLIFIGFGSIGQGVLPLILRDDVSENETQPLPLGKTRQLGQHVGRQ